MKKKDLFRKENYYLIHNYGNGGEPVFKRSENYYYFLRKQEEYMNAHWELIAWNLLPGCYSLMVKIKSNFDADLSVSEIDRIIYTDYGNFIKSYAMSINKAFSRRGSLFAKSFSRKVVLDNYNVKKLICDIHLEPVSAGLVSSPADWKFSSYRNAFLRVPGDQFLAMVKPFGNIDAFFAKHRLEENLRKAG